MSAFLWVEDFEGKQFREFGDALFGRALRLRPMDFPDEEGDLRDLLGSHQILLATTFAEASRVIATGLDRVDFVVLDIDLNLLGEDWEEDRKYVDPLLTRWYQYKASAADEEARYDAARQQMKMVAGYHLFVDLVMNRGFPRDRILFCSNHGDHLERIRNSFEPAKIEAPEIPKKGEEYVKQWIAEARAEPYYRLRRLIVTSCGEMLERLQLGHAKYMMPSMPGDEAKTLTASNAAIMLETLPRLLPANRPDIEEKRLAYRLLVRTLGQDYDKVDFKGKDLRNPHRAYAAVLVHVRNWCAHNAMALTLLNESDVAFLFLVALRASFDLPVKQLEDFEVGLLQMVGDAQPLEMVSVKSFYERSHSDVEERYSQLPNARTPRSFSDMVNDLQAVGKLNVAEQAQRLRQILWHQLHWKTETGFSPQQYQFTRSAFLDELTRRMWSASC